MAKGGLARERFRLKQQRNQIISQLNQLKAEGFSQDQIRAAGPNAFQALQGTNNVVVADGDTLSTIAQSNGTTEADLLAANPELKQVRTGMVINAPVAGSEQWRAQGYGGIGLPSNAALGGTTTNPQGNNPFSSVTGSAGINNPYAQREANTFTALSANAAVQQPPKQPRTPYPLYAQNTQPLNNPYPLYAQNAQVNQATPGTPAVKTTPVRGAPVYTQSSLAGLQAHRITDLFNSVQGGGTPTPAQTAYLLQRGLISPTGGGTGGGFYSRRRKGGGGRGRGGGGSPSYGAQDRLPAFSTGGGFGGLVNWRI